MGFIEVIKERNMLAQITHEDELPKHLSEKPRTAYVGFDPTAESLHVGHLLPVMALRRWQQAGHRVIALVGGGTVMVGDPTGKTEMRKMLTLEKIEEQTGLIKNQLSALLDFSSEDKGIVLNNADWLRDLEYLGFLREVGSHFSVNRMLTAESVKTRLEKGLSFLEFNYMILQSYDFYHLYKNYGCTVQLGGDDQWSNMLGGMDLIRRKERGAAFCATVPLLTNSAGIKMGKTEKGAIWLDPNMTSPYDLFQYFRNIEDDMVKTCLYYFSDLPKEEVESLCATKGKEINDAKVVLGYEITKLLHGEEEAKKARDTAHKLFAEAQQSPEKDAPEVTIESSVFQEKMNILDMLVTAKVMPTKSEARRMVLQGGVSLNGKKVEDIKYEVAKEEVGEGVLIRRGKKHYYYLKISE